MLPATGGGSSACGDTPMSALPQQELPWSQTQHCAKPGPELGNSPGAPSFCFHHPCCCGVYSIPRILFKIISLPTQWEALECMIQNFDFVFCGRPVPSTCLWSWGGYMHSTTEIRQPGSLNFSGVSYLGKSLHSFWGQAHKNPYFLDLKYQCC